jgi:hypothetical protein
MSVTTAEGQDNGLSDKHAVTVHMDLQGVGAACFVLASSNYQLDTLDLQVEVDNSSR